MAPAPSLLPVRKAQAGVPALPRLKSAQSLSSVQPPQHLSRHDNTTLARPIEPATALEDADVTVFGWGDLLGGGDESGADGLLSEGASWLLDRTDFTIADHTLAEDQVQLVDGDDIAIADLEVGAGEEDEVILAQVGGQELPSDRDQVTLERSASQTSHKPTTSSPASAAVDSGKLVRALDATNPTRPDTQPSATSSETRAEQSHPPTVPAHATMTAPFPSLGTTAPSCARSPSVEPAAPTPPRTIFEYAHPAAAETLVPRSLRSADPIAKQAENVQPADLRTLTFALPLEPPPPSRNEQSASAPRPCDLSPFNSPPRNIVPPPVPVTNAVTRPFTLTRPAHILPKNHPGHPRRSVAAAVSVPADPSGQPKKRPEEKGIKSADDAIKRKVREAKVEREKKAKERRDKAEEEAANRAAARKQELARERKKKEEKREVVASRARRDDVAETGKTTARSDTKQTTSRDPEQLGPHPAPFLEPIAAPPTLALDADMSLPAMGAALDFHREVGADGGVFDASPHVTSTPARPQKRHRPAEEPAATHSATANSEAKEVKRARRTTVAMPPRETVEPIKEEEEEEEAEEAEEEHLLTSALKAEPRRRASRLPLAPATENSPLPTYPSQDRAVRVSLRPPDADERRSEPPPTAEGTARPRSMSYRCASRVSFALAPGHDADGAAVPSNQTVSPREQSRRSASRVSLAPAGASASQLSPDGTDDAPQNVHELLVLRKASMSRRASRVPFVVECSAASVDQTAPHPRDGDARPAPDARTSVAKPDPFSPPPSTADPLLRQRQRPPQTLGGVTLPASFSFAAPNTERELEVERRREEKERRDRLAEEVLAEKKRKREGISSWAVQHGVDAKRPRLAGSLSASHDRPRPSSTSPAPRPAAQADRLLSELSVAQSQPRCAPGLASPRVEIDDGTLASVKSCDSAAAVPLTREALERATRKSGPRPDPMRRVSRFLEGIAEASKTDEAGVGDEPGGDALRADLDAPAIDPSAPPTVEAAPLDAFALTVASAPASAAVPPAPSASSALAVCTQVVAPRRRASRAPLSAVIVNNGAQAASPAFMDRLSSWKARESQSLHKTAGRATSVRATLVGARPAPDTLARRQKENAPAAVATGSGRRIVAEKGVAAAMEKQIRERLEWSERQKKREEEVRRKREQMREEEAAREHDKLGQLRASLAARDMRPLAKSALRRTARS